MIIEEVQLLLDLFLPKVPDKETNRLVWNCCERTENWIKADELFREIRRSNLQAIEAGSTVAQRQYCFEEVVAKTLYNLARPENPFDPDSPYWIIKNAISLADAIEISATEVFDIVT